MVFILLALRKLRQYDGQVLVATEQGCLENISTMNKINFLGNILCFLQNTVLIIFFKEKLEKNSGLRLIQGFLVVGFFFQLENLFIQ